MQPVNACGIYQNGQAATDNGPATRRNIFARHPTQYDWEAVWPVFTRLYRYENQSLPVVAERLRLQYGFSASPKMFKDRIAASGLDTYLKPQDVATILWMQDQHPNTRMSFFIRGWPVDIEEVVRNQKRARSNLDDEVRRLSSGEQRPSTNVSVFFLLNQRSLSCACIGKFVFLVEEMRKVLHTAPTMNMCLLDDGVPLRSGANHAAQTNAAAFRSTLWSGIDFYLDRNFSEANLCWQSADLLLENFYLDSDLDMWAMFIMCCLSLQQHGLLVVVRSLTKKLQCLCEDLEEPIPHKSFLEAWLQVSAEDTTEAALFFLQARMMFLRAAWPQRRQLQFLTKLDLAEARLLARYREAEAEIPSISEIDTLPALEEGISWPYLQMQAARISSCILWEDYTGAEKVAQQCIFQMRFQCSMHHSDEQLVPFYTALARVQYIQKKDTEARENYEEAFRLQSLCQAGSSSDVPFSFAGRIKILDLLDWWSSATRSRSVNSGPDESQWAALRKSLQCQWMVFLKKKQSTPLYQHNPDQSDVLPHLAHRTNDLQHMKVSAVNTNVPRFPKPILITNYLHMQLEMPEAAHDSGKRKMRPKMKPLAAANLRTWRYSDAIGDRRPYPTPPDACGW